LEGNLGVVRVAILIVSLLSMTAWSAEAATRSTVIEARIVVVDSCSTAVRPAGQGGVQVDCRQGTPFRMDIAQAAPTQTQTQTQSQRQPASAVSAPTVTITY
jgi:hypothetical protein